MKSKFRKLVAVVTLLMSTAAFAEAELGKDYKLLNRQQPTSTKKVEVLEFFFYGCTHCFHLHPLLSAWEKTMPKDVELIFVPAVFRDSWEPMANTFYALESMGQRQQLHDVLYRAWNAENTALTDLDIIADFVTKHGVDRAKFTTAYSSLPIQGEVTRAKQMIRSYNISGTPTLIVDGKYVIEGLQPEETIRALKKVIVLARKEHIAPPSVSNEMIAMERKKHIAPQMKSDKVYVVISGDTLSAIALRELGDTAKAFDLKTETGRVYNEASAKNLQIGTRLVIPAALANISPK